MAMQFFTGYELYQINSK